MVISYIGYKNQEMKVIPGKSLNIILQEDTETLEEVVVVGYGVQKKSDVTGSVTSVGKERLGKLPVTNVLQAVQGAAAGVTITQTSSIPGDAPDALVRGQNSINANSGPYIVVDGVPISKSGGTLNDINPNDIESMEILKDASVSERRLAPRMRKAFALKRRDAAYVFLRHRNRFNFKNIHQLPLFIFS